MCQGKACEWEYNLEDSSDECFFGCLMTLFTLQLLFGVIPHVRGKGINAKEVADFLVALKREMGEDDNHHAVSEIDEVCACGPILACWLSCLLLCVCTVYVCAVYMCVQVSVKEVLDHTGAGKPVCDRMMLQESEFLSLFIHLAHLPLTLSTFAAYHR